MNINLKEGIKIKNISHFTEGDLSQYFFASNIRTIPHLVDGLKPSQRKVLYICLKNNINKGLKVDQLQGMVSHEALYHHGPNSMIETIVGLSQNFVGKNNINLLIPEGNFGTRYEGGDDSASPRYIKTYLNNISRFIFRKEDDKLLEHLEDEGYKIEPEYYVPIIPMVLVNGVKGIGSGWSTSIPSYNPIEIIDKLILYLEKNKMEFDSLNPYYSGFNGVIKKEANGWIVQGLWRWEKNKIIVEELPIEHWTQNYISYLNDLCDKKIIKDYKNNSDTEKVYFTIIPNKEHENLFADDTSILKILKLEEKISLNNMHLFYDRKIKKYDSLNTIFLDYIQLRLDFYEKRKIYWLDKMNNDLIKLQAVVDFISLIQEDKILIKNRKKKELIQDLETINFIKIDESYDYLLNLNINNLTYEKSEELKKELNNTKKEIKELEKKSIKSLWINELVELKKELI